MNIIVERGKIVKLEKLPPYSIAIDGFVQGPKIDQENNKYSFDHHGNCLRFCTTAACYQVWTAILLGLDPQPYTAYINHIDADSCMAVWCLKHPERCGEPLVKKIVDAICLFDMHGGAFSLNTMHKTVEWISQPEIDSLRNGDYEKLSNDGLLTILESILHRIDLYVNGEASIEIEAKKTIPDEYTIIYNNNGWCMVETQNPHAVSNLYQLGFDKVVTTRPLDDGSIAISIYKKSDFVTDFPIRKILSELNNMEPGWGGGSTAGGAPRNADGSRTRLPLNTIIEVINICIKKKKKM